MSESLDDISRGYTVIPVLEFLAGRRLDDVAGAYISALRPSSVRITTGEIKLDARPWRVTIYVNPTEEFIVGIEQEVEVLLGEGIENGDELHQMAGCPGVTLD